MPIGTRYSLDSLDCPTCNRDDFDTELGVRQHHKQSHGESLPNLICERCNSLFYYKTRRAKCKDCIKSIKKEQEEKEGDIDCPHIKCEEQFETVRARNIHHKLSHGDSISKTTIVCNECDTKHTYNRDDTVVYCGCGNEIKMNEGYNSLNKTPEPCPNCDENMINMGQHWKSDNCYYPELNQRQKDIIRGLIMSDATIQKRVNNNLLLHMTEEKFLNWVVNELSEICHDKYPILYQNSEEARENTADSLGTDNMAKGTEYKTKYKILSRSHPFLNEFDNWYVPEKQYPINDLEVTPIMIKMWYVGDGTLTKHSSGKRATIACTNEVDRIEKVAELIREKGFTVYTKSKGSIQVSSKDTPSFLNWLGSPPTGFEYKWDL